MVSISSLSRATCMLWFVILQVVFRVGIFMPPCLHLFQTCAMFRMSLMLGITSIGLISCTLSVQMFIKGIYFFFVSLSTGSIMDALLHRKSAPTRNLEFIFLLHSALFCERALRCQPTASKQAVHTWKYFLAQDGVFSFSISYFPLHIFFHFF